MKTLLIGINSKYIHPAMGMIQIYANSKYPCILKEFTIKDNKENIINFIKSQEFDLLAFSVYIWNISIIKAIIPDLDSAVPILLGGPEASYRVDDFLQFANVKYIIKDEGEESFNTLIYELTTSNNLKVVPNLYYRDNENFIYTYSKKPNIKNIKYDYSLIKDFKNRIVYLEASRGCCFRCAYCLASLEKTIRYLDIENVKENILYAINQGAKTIKFLDRSFNINPKIINELLQFIIEHDNNYTVFQFEVVGDQLTEETINLLQNVRKGLIRFEIGIQSLNDKVTKAVNRKQNINKLITNINKIKENIVIHLDLIAGLPYEDLNSFIYTFNETFKLFPDELQLGFLKELKGTQISYTKHLHDYVFSNDPPYEIISNKYISSNELDEIRLVEASLNKFYNAGNFPKTINYLFKELKLDPYNTFLKITNYISVDNYPKLQFDELTMKFYQSLINEVPNPDYLFFIIKQDYLTKFASRPKIFWHTSITKDEKSKIYNLFTQKYQKLNLDILYRYAHLEKYQDTYFLILYKPNKEIITLKTS